MKALKLIAIFVIICSSLFLALNWGTLFGEISRNDDFAEDDLIDIKKELEKNKARIKKLEDDLTKIETERNKADSLLKAEKEMESRAQAEAKPNGRKKAQDEAEAKLQAEKKAAAKETLADLIRLINSKDLQKCRNHEYWRSLSQQDRIAIEAVLNLDQFREQVNPQGWYKLQDIKNRTFSFNSLSDVKEVQNEIVTIINEHKR